jgi:hypothetical protein
MWRLWILLFLDEDFCNNASQRECRREEVPSCYLPTPEARADSVPAMRIAAVSSRRRVSLPTTALPVERPHPARQVSCLAQRFNPVPTGECSTLQVCLPVLQHHVVVRNSPMHARIISPTSPSASSKNSPPASWVAPAAPRSGNSAPWPHGGKSAAPPAHVILVISGPK